jgi:hypothetical protein
MSTPRPLLPSDRRALHERGARAALELRAQLDIPMGSALAVYDEAEKLGIEVRFLAAPSLEGMYFRQSPGQGTPLVVVSSLRPAGRQAWTAAHELGHHVFGHGNRIDEYEDSEGSRRASDDPDEVLANSFAGMFLMPKAAVERGFRVRGFDPAAPSALEAYTVAGWLGVGYKTLIHHMQWTLKLLRADRAEALLARKPRQIRTDLMGEEVRGDVMVVDQHWTGRTVDVRVGDVLLLPEDAQAAGASLSTVTRGLGHATAEAIAPGVSQVAAGDWAAFVRCARRDYSGRARYRHIEPSADDEPDNEEKNDAATE